VAKARPRSTQPARPAAPKPAPPPEQRRTGADGSILGHPVVRAGMVAWAVVGLILAFLAFLHVVGLLRLVVVPLVLALFPAALLTPLQDRLVRLKVPPALATLAVLLGTLGLLVLVGFVLVPQVASELPTLTSQVQSGLDQLQGFLDDGPFGIDPQVVRDGISDLQANIAESDVLRTGVLGAAGAVAEIGTMLLLLLVFLFFYLKDGSQIAAWLRRLFPARAQHDVGVIGDRGWTTVGAYFRGQLFIAFVDALLIGIGLAIIGVPLALPLAVLIFLGGLFPIVGAVASGTVAVLVALASGGLSQALIVLAIVLGVQQLEGNVLAPLVLGKATALHPLAVIVSLTIGGILLGVLGAFLAVPIAASATRAVGYIRERSEGDPPATTPAAARAGG
jgi:putative heme transporter